MVFLTALSLAVAGCAQGPESASSQDAISTAKTMESVDAQVQYLVDEAHGFVNSEQYQQAADTAQYVLANLDSQSQEAKSVLEQARQKLQQKAEAKVDETASKAKDALGSLGQ